MSDLVGNPEDRFSRVAAHSRTTNFDEIVATSLSSPSVLSNLFWQELIWCQCCSCICLLIRFYDIHGTCFANDVFDGIYTKVKIDPSCEQTENKGCEYCVVKMPTGTLKVDTTTAKTKCPNHQRNAR